MTKTEFDGMFRSLKSHVPTFKIPDEEMVKRIYFESLHKFSFAIASRAIREMAENGTLQYFPPVSDIVRQCNVIGLDQKANQYPKVKYWPKSHGCGLDGKPMDFAGPRGMVYAMNHYEAIHMLCKGHDFHPVCPWCGSEQAPWVNPVFRMYMEIYPSLTVGWNPYIKGNMLCGACEKLEYPRDFLK